MEPNGDVLKNVNEIPEWFIAKTNYYRNVAEVLAAMNTVLAKKRAETHIEPSCGSCNKD